MAKHNLNNNILLTHLQHVDSVILQPRHEIFGEFHDLVVELGHGLVDLVVEGLFDGHVCKVGVKGAQAFRVKC